MIKALCKKSRDNKGFSLIELIVVIAIIAILALILVPRFGGFTGEAKAAADAATMKTIETAVIALMSNGKIVGENGTITIKNSSESAAGKITFTGVRGKAADLQEMIGTEYKSVNGGKGFEVTITNGNVSCKTY